MPPSAPYNRKVSRFGARKRGMRKSDSGIIALGRLDWERRNRANRASPPSRGQVSGRSASPIAARRRARRRWPRNSAWPARRPVVQRVRRSVAQGAALRYAGRQQHDHQDDGEIEEKNPTPGRDLDEPATDYGANRGKDSGPGRPGANGAAPFLFRERRLKDGEPWGSAMRLRPPGSRGR